VFFYGARPSRSLLGIIHSPTDRPSRRKPWSWTSKIPRRLSWRLAWFLLSRWSSAPFGMTGRLTRRCARRGTALGGINIRSRPDRADLVREIAAQKPDLVCVGPWYKLTRRKNNESWEDAALEALAILDDLRTKYGFALMIEAHSPKGDGRHRDLHPLGSVYLSAWPELGIGLVKEEDSPHILDVIHWRGARLKQLWPNQILRDPRMIISGKWGSHVGRIDF
jgi:hypothetical protein